MSTDSQRPTQRYIPKYMTVHSYHNENLKANREHLTLSLTSTGTFEN
jgi:hypothetical protein